MDLYTHFITFCLLSVFITAVYSEGVYQVDSGTPYDRPCIYDTDCKKMLENVLEKFEKMQCKEDHTEKLKYCYGLMPIRDGKLIDPKECEADCAKVDESLTAQFEPKEVRCYCQT